MIEIKTETPSSTAADCWAAALAREEIAVSGGKKVLLAYGDVEVTSAGLVLNAFAGGFPSVVDRGPTVEILGRRSLLDRQGLGFSRGTYTVATDDLPGTDSVLLDPDARRCPAPPRRCRSPWLCHPARRKRGG